MGVPPSRVPPYREVELRVSPAARELGLIARHLVAENLANRDTSSALDDFRASVYQRLASRYTRGYLKRDPVLAGFRELRRRVGGNAQELPCSTDSLVRQLRRNGELPSINPVVDVYNCVALETRLTLGAHDLDRVRGEIVLTRASGGERFQPLGGGPEQELEAGEYCYVDGSGDVLCRLDYKQADRTRVTAETTRALFILQGNPNTTAASIELARDRLALLLQRYCTRGGEDDDRPE